LPFVTQWVTAGDRDKLAGALGIDPVAAAQAKLKLNELKYPAVRARGSSRKHSEL